MKTVANNSTDQYDYLTSRIFAFQERCLQLFGFLYPRNGNRSNTARLYSTFLTTSFLTGGVFCATLYIVSVVWVFAVTESKNPLLSMLAYIPYAFTIMRAICVLSICWRNSSCWYNYQKHASTILRYHSRPELLHSKARKWRILSVILGVLSFVAVVVFEVADWFHWFDQDPRRCDMFYDAALSPMPMRLLVWEYIVLWNLFSAFLYFLSQQLYIALILYACIMKSALHDIRSCLQMELKSEGMLKIASKGHGQTEERYESFYGRMRNAKSRYFDILRFSHDLNATYGNVVFIICCMDLITICGFVAALVANEEKFLTAYLGNCLSIVIFGSYICCLAPMVGVYEEVAKINLALHRVTEMLQSAFDAFAYQRDGLKCYVVDFIALVRDQPIMFSGAELIHITRGFLAGTITFIVSSAVILREVVQRTEDSHQLITVSSTTANNSLLLEAALNSSLLYRLCSNATGNF